MDKHTKGPWTIETPCGFPYSGLYVVPVVRKDFPCYIAQIRQFREREESEANAELIASAPTLKQQRDDLLAVCRNGLTTLAVISMPRLDNNVATDADLLKILAESLKAAITKCET